MTYTSQLARFTSYKNGETPRVGDNGNWYIGDEDTGVRAKALDGVSFSGITEYYYATLATKLDGDGNPTPPEWDGDEWEKAGWKTSISATGFGTPGDKNVIHKYLWNVEAVKSKEVDGSETEVYTDVNLLMTYEGGRTPMSFISYYYASPTSTPDETLVPELDDEGNNIVVPEDSPWSKDTDLMAADEFAFLFEKTFIEYDSYDDNGKNKFAVLEGITLIGHNGVNAQDFSVTADTYALKKEIYSDPITYTNTATLTAHWSNIDATNTDIKWYRRIENVDIPIKKVDSDTGEQIDYTGKTLVATEPGAYVAKYSTWEDFVTVIAVEDGSNAISVVLTNPNMVFHANVSDETEDCEVMVYQGAEQLTYDSELAQLGTFYVDLPEGTEGVILNDDGKLIIEDKTDNDSVDITVHIKSKDGKTSEKVMTIYWKVISNGKDGRSFVGVTEWYIASTGPADYSNITAPDGETWKTSISQTDFGEEYKYLWNIEEISSEKNGEIEVTCTKPDIIQVWNGRTVEEILSFYATSTNTTVPDGAPELGTDNNEYTSGELWSSQLSTNNLPGTFLWEATITKYYHKDTSEKNLYSIIPAHIIGFNGNDGKGIELKGSAYCQETLNADSIDKKYELFSDQDFLQQITNPNLGDSYIVQGYLLTYSGIDNYFLCAGKIEGRGINTVLNYYMASARSEGVKAGEDGTGAYENEEWTTDVQQPTKERPYLWNYEIISYSDGKDQSTEATIVGTYVEGRGIAGIKEYYCISASTSIDNPEFETLERAGEWTAENPPDADTWYTNPPITDSTNRYLWNVEKIDYTKQEGIDDPGYQITTPTIIGTHGEDGESPYTLMLSNEFDTWVKSSAGDWISGNTITITASLYYGSVLQQIDVNKISANPPDNITLDKELNDDGKTVQLTLTRGDNYTSTEKVSITFDYTDANCSLNKTFTIQTISSLVDYDLILPSRVIHTGSKPESIQIQVLKKTADGTTTLSGPDENEPIKLLVNDTSQNSWTISLASFTETMNFELRSTSDPGLIWDQEALEFVDDGQDFNVTADSYVLKKASPTDTSYTNSVTATAHLINITEENVTWYQNEDIKGTGKTLTITSPGTYTAKCDSWEDSVTITEVVDGSVGEAAISVVLTNPTMTFNTNVAGETENCRVIVYEGGTALTAKGVYDDFTDGTFRIIDPTNCSIDETYKDTVKVSDTDIEGESGGIPSFTVNIKSSKGKESSQSMTIHCTVVENGTSPYLIELDNDSATIGTNVLGGYDPQALITVTTMNVSVFEGGKNITDDCDYEWTAINGVLDNYILKKNHFTSLTADNCSATVTVNKKDGTLIGTKTFNISKNKQGATGSKGDTGSTGPAGPTGPAAVTYQLLMSPNSWNKNTSATIKPTATVIKYTGSSATTLTSGYTIKVGNNTWSGGSISSTTTFDLIINNVKVDSETVTMVQNGVGTKGDTGDTGATAGTITIYYLQTKPTSGTPQAPNVPTSTTSLNNNWLSEKPKFDADNNKTYSYLWSTSGTFTKTSNGVITYGTTWETPKLIEARNDLGVPYDVYAEYLRLTNFEQSNGFYYGTKGANDTSAPLYINASHINTGTFEVKKNDVAAFKVGWNGSTPIVQMGGWEAGSTSLTTTNTTLGTSGFYMYSSGSTTSATIAGSGNKTDWRLVIGSSFGVDSSGNIYAKGGKIGGWTIGSSSLTYGSLGVVGSFYMYSSGSTGSTSIGGSGNKTNWRLAIGPNFGVDSNGYIYAKNAKIAGTIEATGGNIAGWTIGTTTWKSYFEGVHSVTGVPSLYAKKLLTHASVGGVWTNFYQEAYLTPYGVKYRIGTYVDTTETETPPTTTKWEKWKYKGWDVLATSGTYVEET